MSDRQPGSASRAVFLSYASQDATAVAGIAGALRAAGIEVWFDQSDLSGGDAWDQKIRGQIRSCALFVPIISANTQSRREGYFRLEWKLAAQRTHTIADGTPFLLPILIDATHEGEALVPEEFRAVQWTRLAGGAVTPAFVARVQALLVAPLVPAPPTVAAPTFAARGRKTPVALFASIAVVAIALILYAALRPARPESPVPPPSKADGKPAAAADAPVAGGAVLAPEFPRNAELRQARKLIFAADSIAEDFALAEDLVKPLLAAQPNDPEIVTVAAEVSAEYLSRGFDQTQARRAQAQRLGERAVQLAPDNPAALAALGRYLRFVPPQRGRAEDLLRRAIKLDPREPRYYRELFSVLVLTKPGPETDAFGKRMAELFPNDPLVVSELATLRLSAGDLAAAEAGFDRALTLAPLANAITWKAKIRLEVHGDVEGMKLWLDRMPERQRTDARLVNAYVVEALVTGQTDSARRVLDSITDTWLADGTYIFPKALLMGELEQIDGHEDVARLQYEAALKEVQNRLAADPTDLRPVRAELWIQLGLARRDAARAALRVNLQKRPRPYRWTLRLTWWTSSLRACLLLDERAEAMAQLREACAEPQGRQLLRNLFRVDPKMAPFRNDQEIVALLLEPKTETAPLPLGEGKHPPGKPAVAK